MTHVREREESSFASWEFFVRISSLLLIPQLWHRIEAVKSRGLTRLYRRIYVIASRIFISMHSVNAVNVTASILDSHHYQMRFEVVKTRTDTLLIFVDIGECIYNVLLPSKYILSICPRLKEIELVVLCDRRVF